jgi:hypothetical protein
MHFVESIFDVSPDGGSGILGGWLVCFMCVVFSVGVWWKYWRRTGRYRQFEFRERPVEWAFGGIETWPHRTRGNPAAGIAVRELMDPKQRQIGDA